MLGNLFLHHIDAILSKTKGTTYMRYVDDIRILANSEPEAKIALKILDSQLREHGLDINPAKTKIYSPEEVEKELRDHRKKDLDLIGNMLQSRSRMLVEKGAIPLLRVVFEESFAPNNAYGERHLKFALYRFIRLRDHLASDKVFVTEITEKLLRRIESLPGLIDWFSRFFSAYPSNSTKAKLIEFLKSQANIYEWQEMWVLDTLLRFPTFEQDDLEVFEKIAFDKNRHPLCRAKAILLLGKYGDNHVRHRLASEYNSELDPLIRRAILIGTQELPRSERNPFYGRVKGVEPEQGPTINFLKSRRKPIYFDDYIPPSIPIEGPY